MRKRKILIVTGLLGLLLAGGLLVMMIGIPLNTHVTNPATGKTAPTEQGQKGPMNEGLQVKDIKPAIIPGSYIVVIKDTRHFSPGEITTMAHTLATRYHGRLTHIYTAALHGFSVQIAKAQAQMLAKDAQVASVEQDMTAPLLSTSMQATTMQPDMTQATINTTQANASWDLDRLDQPNLPLSGTYTYDTKASNVSVYVLDTGIRLTHTEFGGRAYSVANGGDNNDCAGHGTMVAGVIGGATFGVAKNVKLYSLRMLSCQNEPATSDGLAGVDWVTANAQRPAVVNISWHSSLQVDLNTAISNSIQSGITYVAAAGNSNADACGDSPQSAPGVIVAGSSNSDDARSGFSNYGKCVTLFAPGENIPTSSFASDTATTAVSGTSFSAPLTAGAAALYLSTHPSATPAQVKAALVACAISGIIPNPGVGSPNKLLNTQCDQTIKVTNPGQLMSIQGQTMHLQLQSTDPNVGQAVTYSARYLPAGLSLNASTGMISGTFAGGRINTVLLTAKDGAGSTGIASFNWLAIKGYGAITNGSGTCADDNTSGTTNGNPIQVWGCGQQWTVNIDNTLMIFGKCMTVSGGGTANGTPIVLYDCSAAPAQIWQPQPNGTLLNPASGRCLTEPSSGWGTRLTLADCTTATTQQWKLPDIHTPNILNMASPGDQLTDRGTAASLHLRAFDTGAGQTITYSATGLPAGLAIDAVTGIISGTPIADGTSSVKVTAKDDTGASVIVSFKWQLADGPITGLNGQCLDDRLILTTNGNPIQLIGCNQSAAQQWTLGPGNTLEVVGKCLTISGAGTANGTPIVLYDCSAIPSQIWQPQANGTLLNPASGRCLSIPATNPQLILADCTNTANQQWKLPFSDSITMTNPGDQSGIIGTALSLPIKAMSFNPLQTLSYSATGLPTGLAINAATGLISGTPTIGEARTVTVTAKDSAGVTGVASFSWTFIKGYGFITNGNGTCADDNSSNDSNGNPIQVWACGQQWTVNLNNTLMILGKCMTVSGGGIANGTPIVLYDCSAAPSQIWQPQPNRTLLNPVSGRCLNEPSSGRGTQLTLANCTTDTNQQWVVPGVTYPNKITLTSPGDQATSLKTAVSVQIKATDSDAKQTLSYSATGLPSGLVINTATGLISGTPIGGKTSTVTVTAKDSIGVTGVASFSWMLIKGHGSITNGSGTCADDNSSNTSNGNSIQVWGCGQQWSVNTDNALMILGKCMTVSGGGTANGTPIVLYDCSAAPSQIWLPQANGTLLNPASGRCLNEPNSGWGTQLTLADCTTATTQQWTLPTSS